MAGTLTLSTLSDGTTSTSATNVIRGPAKTWVNFNGGFFAPIRSSYNVSSVTRNSNGNYTIAFTNALSNANYAILVTPYDISSTSSNGLSTHLSSTTTTNAVIIVGTYSAGVYDATYICVSIFD
jgi:hypothetical protein